MGATGALFAWASAKPENGPVFGFIVGVAGVAALLWAIGAWAQLKEVRMHQLDIEEKIFGIGGLEGWGMFQSRRARETDWPMFANWLVRAGFVLALLYAAFFLVQWLQRMSLFRAE